MARGRALRSQPSNIIVLCGLALTLTLTIAIALNIRLLMFANPTTTSYFRTEFSPNSKEEQPRLITEVLWNSSYCAPDHRFYVFEPPSCASIRSSKSRWWVMPHRLNPVMKVHPCRTPSEDEAVAGWIAWDFDELDNRLGYSKYFGDVLRCVVDMEQVLNSSVVVRRYGPEQIFFARGNTAYCCYQLMRIWRDLSRLSRMVSVLTIEPPSEGFFYTGESKPPLFTVHPQCWTPTPKSSGFFGVPYMDWTKDTVDTFSYSSSVNKTLLMTGYLGEHGTGVTVRQALNYYCKQLPQYDCRLVPLEELDSAYSAAKYVLCPAGDSPSRHGLWTAMYHAAVPVLFSSCKSNFYSLAYSWFLPPNHLQSQQQDEFGAGRWAVLLNSTSAILNATYVRDELRAIDDETYSRMRAEIRKIVGWQAYSSETDLERGPYATDIIVHRMSRRTIALSSFDSTAEFASEWRSQNSFEAES